VGLLALAFNRMSADLARAHDELRQSTEQVKQQAARLKELSIRDALTHLYNRRYFDEQARTMFAQSARSRQPLTFMIGDVDFFKRINDQFSHAVGDEVLRRVAYLLQTSVRESDVVARYGGEEFVIAFSNSSVRQSSQVCEKLRRVIEAHPWHEVHSDLRVTMSFGLSDDLYLGSWERVVASADHQLYRAKEGGRNRVCFDDTHTARAPFGLDAPPGAA
jgi:two-component system, cell cycle response regulator